MTAFDYVVLTILAASILISVLRGLVKEILSLAAWIAAFVVANQFAAPMAAALPNFVPDAVPGGTVRLMAGFGILFIGTLLLGALINLAIGQLITALGLKVVDRGMGGLFGLARGIVIVLTLVILAGLTQLPRQAVWRDALLSPMAESAARTIKPWLPDDWARHVHF